MKRLAEKSVLVTGGSKGIGATIAQHVSAEGVKVIINYSGSDGDAEQTVNSIRERGGEGINVKGVFNTLRKATTHLADNATIINLSTTISRLMVPNYGTNTASKIIAGQLPYGMASRS